MGGTEECSIRARGIRGVCGGETDFSVKTEEKGREREGKNRALARASPRGCSMEVSAREEGWQFSLSCRKYHLEDRKRSTRFPLPARRRGREVAAGVKSGCVRKGDRSGKLAKTARTAREGRRGGSERARAAGGTAGWRAKGRSDERAQICPRGVLTRETGKF